MKKKFNILQVTGYLEMGVLETLIVEICKSINREKFNIQVLCLIHYDLIYKENLNRKGIPVYLMRKNGRLDLSFFRKFINFIKDKKIDLIHTHSGCLFNSAICGQLSGLKGIIYTAHGLPIKTDLKSTIEDTIASLMVDRIIAVSDEIKDDLRKRLPLSQNKISLISNGVDTTIFLPVQDQNTINEVKKTYQIPLDKKIIGTVGRLEKIKNYDMLIQCFRKVIENYGYIAHLVFIGDGSERESLKALVRKLDLIENISFLGTQYNLYNIITIFDIFTISSFSEGMSIALLEAQSCGIPAVVTNVGGNSKIIKNNHNGFLCQSNNPDDMYRKISMLLDDSHIQKKLGQNARNTVVNHFDLHVMVRSYEDIYQKILSKSHR